jgi:hypothetical protein
MCMPMNDRTYCDADFDGIGVKHADYPHNPGTLYDCPACEQVCHCDADDVVTMGDERDKCVHCQDDDSLDEFYGVDQTYYMDDDYPSGYVSDFNYLSEQ